MEANPHARRLTRLAIEGARADGSTGADYLRYVGNFDHIEFEKHEAGDYRAIIEGAELRIQAVNVNGRKRPEWVVLVRPTSQLTVQYPFSRISDPFPSMKEAVSDLFNHIKHDGSAVWHWE